MIKDLIAYNPFDYVEPCEPDCSPERHAYHQGQWDMAGRICKDFGVLPNPADGNDIPAQALAQLEKLITEQVCDNCQKMIKCNVWNYTDQSKDTKDYTK